MHVRGSLKSWGKAGSGGGTAEGALEAGLRGIGERQEMARFNVVGFTNHTGVL